jgi:hypothetical protein
MFKRALPIITIKFYQPVIPKSEAVMARLRNCRKGFSFGIDELYPESDSILFSKNITHSRSRRSRENIALNTLGTIIHETLKTLLRTHRKFISERDLENCFKQIDAEVLKQFKVVYRKERLRKVEIFAFEVAKRNV